MKKLGIHTSFQFVYLFTICKTCTLVPESILESVLEFVLESEYQALESLDFRPIFAYNSSNISCFSRKCADYPLHFASHEPWHSRGQRFDPAYLHQKSSEEARKTLKSLDFKVFSFPKVGNSQYSLFAPVRLIFDGNFENQFENQEVRNHEENQVELRRHHGGNLCRLPHFPQSKGVFRFCKSPLTW